MNASRLLAIAAAASAAATFALPAYAYQETEVSDGGTIKGKITYTGNVPTRKIIPSKDQDVCGGIRDEPKIHVGDDGGVQDAVVYLKDIEKGKKWPKQEKTPEIDNVDCTFKPHVQVVRPGKFDIVNTDPILHNTHGFYGRRTAFNLALPNKGQVIEKRLRRPGTVRVECDSHGWMLGWVYVADSPYYVMTNDDGTYSLENVPPGNYTLVAQQNEAGDFEKKVTVKAGDTTSVDVDMTK